MYATTPPPTLRNDFMALVERQGERHIARCAEFPGVCGEGWTRMAALVALREEVLKRVTALRTAAVRTANQQTIFDTIHLG